MLAYCTVYGLKRGHLVYAAGNEKATQHVVREAATTIHVHALAMDSAISDLVRQVPEFATAIANAEAQDSDGRAASLTQLAI
jgi:5-methylcytosine-specific restriction enzyme subunit McrC